MLLLRLFQTYNYFNLFAKNSVKTNEISFYIIVVSNDFVYAGFADLKKNRSQFEK